MRFRGRPRDGFADRAEAPSADVHRSPSSRGATGAGPPSMVRVELCESADAARHVDPAGTPQVAAPEVPPRPAGSPRPCHVPTHRPAPTIARSIGTAGRSRVLGSLGQEPRPGAGASTAPPPRRMLRLRTRTTVTSRIGHPNGAADRDDVHDVLITCTVRDVIASVGTARARSVGRSRRSPYSVPQAEGSDGQAEPSGRPRQRRPVPDRRWRRVDDPFPRTRLRRDRAAADPGGGEPCTRKCAPTTRS